MPAINASVQAGARLSQVASASIQAGACSVPLPARTCKDGLYTNRFPEFEGDLRAER